GLVHPPMQHSFPTRRSSDLGDTPLGMVESALEFARIARDLDYHAFVFSMKSSNPKVMINAYRLLVARLREEGEDWNYPIHLGVRSEEHTSELQSPYDLVCRL